MTIGAGKRKLFYRKAWIAGQRFNFTVLPTVPQSKNDVSASSFIPYEILCRNTSLSFTYLTF
jgi:hypothetical protein